MPKLQQVDEDRRRQAGLGRDYSEALARGLDVLLAFNQAHPVQTLSEVAAAVGLPRATARRALLTLEALGYVTLDGRRFSLTPRVLLLARAYLTSNAISTLLQPACDRIARAAGASCSAAVLDGDEVVMVARAIPAQLMPAGAGVGYRLPAYCSALGRVLLGALPDADLEAYLRRVRLTAVTQATRAGVRATRAAILEARAQGHCFVDQEAEMGFRSVAVPLRRFDGTTVAALNIGAPVASTEIADMTGRLLDLLAAEAAGLSGALI